MIFLPLLSFLLFSFVADVFQVSVLFQITWVTDVLSYLHLAARGFVDRRRVRKLKKHATDEANKILHFLAHIERLGNFITNRESMLDKIPVSEYFHRIVNFN